MSTRASIKIKESFYMTNEDAKQKKLTECIINLYHHSDGYPEGVGSDLKEFLKDRNDYLNKNNGVLWDAESIALDLVRGAIRQKDRETGEEKPDMGYVPAICQHGDCEYGYEIDCDNRTLKCYELEPDEMEWREENVVPIPDKRTEQ